MNGSLNPMLAQLHREDLMRVAERERLKRSIARPPRARRRLLVLMPLRDFGYGQAKPAGEQGDVAAARVGP
jgi:hypothetical protein